jgi:hypothetical protein
MMFGGTELLPTERRAELLAQLQREREEARMFEKIEHDCRI